MIKNVEKWVHDKDLEKGYVYYSGNMLNYLTVTDTKLEMGATFSPHLNYLSMTDWLISKGILKISDSIDISYAEYQQLFEQSYHGLFEFELLRTAEKDMTPNQLIYRLYSNYTGDIFGWYDEEAPINEKIEFVMKIHEHKSEMFVELADDEEQFEKLRMSQKKWEDMEWGSQEEVYWKSWTDFEKVQFVFEDEEFDMYFNEAVISIFKRVYRDVGIDLWSNHEFNMHYLKEVN